MLHIRQRPGAAVFFRQIGVGGFVVGDASAIPEQFFAGAVGDVAQSGEFADM